MREHDDETLASEIREIFPGVYMVPDPKNVHKNLLATRNLTPGKVFYGEHIVRTRIKGETAEFRLWDPFRSKLSASILRGLEMLPFREGSSCLYLGASTGTTVSHISDIIGEKGRVFAVEMAQRVAREFLQSVVRYRRNVVPIIADARHPNNYHSVYGNINTIYCDIAQPDQTEIAVANCEWFFSDEGGILFLVVKASSIDVLKDKESVFEEQSRILKRSGFDVIQEIDLAPYDRNHAMLVSRSETLVDPKSK